MKPLCLSTGTFWFRVCLWSLPVLPVNTQEGVYYTRVCCGLWVNWFQLLRADCLSGSCRTGPKAPNLRINLLRSRRYGAGDFSNDLSLNLYADNETWSIQDCTRCKGGGKGAEHIFSEQTCFSEIIFQEHTLPVLETESGIALKNWCWFINS